MRNSTAQRWYSGILFPILLLALISPTFELECTWGTGQVNTAADGEEYDELKVNSILECQQKCEDDREKCTLITFLPSDECRRFDNIPTDTEVSIGTTMIDMESCPGEPSQCAMEKTQDRRPTASVALSVQMTTGCSDLCKFTATCRAYSYSSSECFLFTSVPTTTDDNSFTHVVVQENSCEESSESGKKGTGAWKTLALDVTGCNTVCLEYTECTAVADDTTSCYFYTTDVSDTTVNNQYDLYEKHSSCPAGTVPTRTCSGQSSVTRAETSKHLALWVSLTVALALLHELQ